MSAADFDRLYLADRDPWRVSSSWYEQRKLNVVLAALSERRYQRAMDPACGTGHLARELSARCDEVVGADASRVAIDIAREVCAGIAHLTLHHRRLPYPSPPAENEGEFDLVVLSEILYYLPLPQRREAIDSILQRAAHRVEILAVHWSEQPEEGLIPGERAHVELRTYFAEKDFRHQVAHFDEEFVLDVFTRGHDHYLE